MEMTIGQVRPYASVRPLALAMGLALMAVVLAHVVWFLHPPASKGTESPADEFSAGRALAVVRELVAEGTAHQMGSANSDRVRERIMARLKALGYEPDVQEALITQLWSGTAATCAQVHNVVTRLPGQRDGPAVFLLAHYDSVGAGPGAADDASGVAALLEIARIARQHGPYRNPVIFLFTDGEEAGLLGARAFVTEHPWAQNVGVAINLEAGGSTGLSIMYETSNNNAWLIDAYASSVSWPAANSVSYDISRRLPYDTDLTVFRNAGKAGLNFSFGEGRQRYHTLLDDVNHLDPGSLQHQGDGVLAVMRRLAMMDLSNPPTGDAAYTAVPSLGVIRWPAAWTIPLAILVALLLLVAILALVLRKRVTVVALLAGLLVALLTVVLPVLLGLGLTWLVPRVAGELAPWYAYPLPIRLSLWAGALLCGGLAAIGLARWAGVWGLGLGAWLLWALLGLLASFTLPGAAILFLIPAFCTALLLLAVVAFSRLADSTLAREVVFIAATPVAGLIWMPLALVLEYAVGLEVSPAITFPVALIVSTLLPLFALPKGRTGARTVLTIAAAAVTVLAAAVAMFVPPYSESRPQPLNILLAEDRDAGVARWVADPAVGHTPSSLRQRFDAEAAVVFPWSDSQYPVATGPASTAPAPDLQVLSDERNGGARVVKTQVRSPRGGSETFLLVPIKDLQSVTVAGHTLSVRSEDSRSRYFALSCYGLASDGLTVSLRFASADPVEALVVDSSPGLPSSGDTLLKARMTTAVPHQNGDVTIVWHRVKL